MIGGINQLISAGGGGSGPARYSVRLFTGTYDVTLTTPFGSTLAALPPDADTPLGGPLVVDGDRTLDYDLRVATVTGALTLEGAAVPDSPGLTSRGTITFQDRVTSDTTSYAVGATGPGSYSVRLFAGSYNVRFATATGGSLQRLPPGARTPLAIGVIVGGDRTLDYDLRLYTVTGSLTLGGAALPDSPGGVTRGTVSFHNRAGDGGDGGSSVVSGTGPARYSARLFAGTYNVTWTATPTQGAQLWIVAVQ